MNVTALTPPSKAKTNDPEQIRKVLLARCTEWLDERLERVRQTKEPITEIVTLSPELAMVFLSRNAGNRHVSETNLERIKKDILHGNWVFNGESIVISDTGELNDGQHRCRAVVETGVPVRMAIVIGAKRETRMTLDQGATRTIGHYLSMKGHTHANALGTAVNYYAQYKERGQLSNSGHLRPTKAEMLLYIEKHRGLSESVSYVSRPGASSIASIGMLAFCRYAFFEAAGEDAANEFIDRLLSGAGLHQGNPILYCRNRLIETKTRANIQERAELIFKAFNAWRLGERVERIVVAGVKLPKLER